MHGLVVSGSGDSRLQLVHTLSLAAWLPLCRSAADDSVLLKSNV